MGRQRNNSSKCKCERRRRNCLREKLSKQVKEEQKADRHTAAVEGIEGLSANDKAITLLTLNAIEKLSHTNPHQHPTPSKEAQKAGPAKDIGGPSGSKLAVRPKSLFERITPRSLFDRIDLETKANRQNGPCN